MRSTSSPEKVITWTTSQVVLATVFVVCVFLTFWLLYRLRILILLFFVAVVLGTAIRPGVEWLRRKGIARNTGIIIIYVLIAALTVGFLYLTLPLLADQATQISQTIPQYYGALREGLVNSGNRLLQNIGLRLPSRLSLFLNRDPSSEAVINQVTQTVFYANIGVKAILSVLAVFLLAYYWTQESNLAIRTLLRLVPNQRRNRILNFFSLAETKIGGYIRGQGILCLAVGTAAFFAYFLIGLPYILILAIIAGIMEMVPIFGPALGAIPALLTALSTEPEKAIWVLVATGVIQMMENAWLVPRVMRHSMGVNPIITLLSLVGFGSVLGFPGALLALPLAAIIQLLFDQVLLSPESTTEELAEDLQSLIDENTRLQQILTEARETALFSNVSDSDQTEIKAIVQELGDALHKLSNGNKAA